MDKLKYHINNTVQKKVWNIYSELPAAAVARALS